MQELGCPISILVGTVLFRVQLCDLLCDILPDRLDQDRGDAAGDLVLDGKDVVHRPVEAVRPDMVASLGVDQLRRDPGAIPGLANAAFEDVARSELLGGLTYVRRSALVCKG